MLFLAQKKIPVWALLVLWKALPLQTNSDFPDVSVESAQICGVDDRCANIYKAGKCYGTLRTVGLGETLRISSVSRLERGCKWIFTARDDSSYQCCYGNTDQCSAFNHHHENCRSQGNKSARVTIDVTKCSLQICNVTHEDDGSYDSIDLYTGNVSITFDISISKTWAIKEVIIAQLTI